MTPKGGRGLAAMLAKGDEPEESAGDDYESGKMAAAEAAMAAFKSGDVEALKSALSDFVSMCM